MTKTLTQVPKLGQYVTYEGSRKPWLTIGKEYRINKIDRDGDAEFLDDDGDIAWIVSGRNLKDFALAPSNTLTEIPRKGQVVSYVGERNAYLTIGKAYEIFEVTEDGDAVYRDDEDDIMFITEDEMSDFELVAAASPTFEIGDKVRILDVSAIFMGSTYWNDGDITEVVSFFGSNDRPQLRRTVPSEGGARGDSLFIHPGEFHAIGKVTEEADVAELFEEESAFTTFEVGDKVRMIDRKAISGSSFTENGEIYEVVGTSIRGNIIIDDKSGGYDLVVFAEEMHGIEKVEEDVPVAKQSTQFNVGDEVVITNLRGALNGFSIGDTVVITTTDSGGRYQYGVKHKSGDCFSGFADAHSLALSSKVGLLKMPEVGDVIRFTKESRFGLTKGKTYTIVSIDEDGDANFVSDVDQDVYGLASVVPETIADYTLVSSSPVPCAFIIEGTPVCGKAAALEARVDALETRLKALETGNVDITVAAPPAPNDNFPRKAAIEKASAFLTSYDGRGNLTGREGFRAGLILCDAEYMVDYEKRTVTCKLVGQMGNSRVYSIGIAKCNPEDVFNVTLGKAISLGRARDKDVTAFEQAPQPSEVVPGVIIQNGRVVDEVRPTHRRGGSAFSSHNLGFTTTCGIWNFIDHAIIVEDTDAKY